MKVFFDCEFTGLHQNTTLISIGLIDEINRSFYAEFGDYNYHQIDRWLEDHILTQLKFHDYTYSTNMNKEWCNCSVYAHRNTEAYGNTEFIKSALSDWLSEYNYVEMWSDCLAYDWVLFCNLWGHAFNIPENINYIPFDICTLFNMKRIDPDINREEFSGKNNSNEKHNALWDAIVIKSCYYQLMDL